MNACGRRICLCLAAAMAARAQTPMIWRGVVKDATGLTIPRAEVQLIRNGVEGTRSVTGASGEFQLAGQDARLIEIRVSAPGFQTVTRALQPAEAGSGAVYPLANGLAPYFSYSESFLPIAGFDFYNNPYKPQRGKQWEAGAKYQSVNGKVMVTAALFDLRETNRRTPDPANARNSIQVGEVQSRGGEIELRGRLPLGFDLRSSYTYDLARISKSNSTDLGKRLSTMPLHLGSIWVTKLFRVSPTSKVIVGPGYRYTGSSFDGIDVLRTPSYGLVDAMVSWETPTWRIGLNGSNLADKTYLAACLSRGDCFFGSRRNATVTLSYRF